MASTSNLPSTSRGINNLTEEARRSTSGLINPRDLNNITTTTSLTTMAINLTLREDNEGILLMPSPLPQREKKRARFNSSTDGEPELHNTPATSSATMSGESSTAQADRLNSNPTGIENYTQETLKTFRVHSHAEDLWKQARNNFFYAERANLRAERLSSWASEGLLPAWAIGKGNIPQHLVSDTENSNIISIMLFEHGRDLVNALAKSLEKVSNQKLASAKALLKTVQEIYGEDKESYTLAALKLKNIVNKYTAQIQSNLDHQEAAMRAQKITPEKALELRTSLAPEKRARRRRSATPTRSRPNSRSRSRSRSRSPNPRPSRATNQNQQKRRRSRSNQDNRKKPKGEQLNQRQKLTRFLQNLIGSE